VSAVRHTFRVLVIAASASASASALTAMPRPGRAGALGDVLKGISRAAGGAPGGGGAAPSTAGSGAGNVLGAVLHGLADWAASPVATGDPVYVLGSYGAFPPTPSAATDGYAYVGLQSVAGSTGSFTLEVRATHGDFGLGLRGTTFFESPADPMLPAPRLDLGTLGAHFRALRDGGSALWLEVALAGLSTFDNLTLFGAMGGGRLSHDAGAEVGVEAQAHVLVFEDGVRALEVVGSLRLSVLRLSYRLVDFNVGPPLHGPEAGLALTF
jgi:hypothetical protein